MTWRSIHPNHAIERVRLIFSFKDPLPNKLLRRLSSEVEAYRVELGFSEKNFLPGQQFTIGPQGAEVSGAATDIARWEMKRTSASNRALEILSVDNSSLTYETMDYTRWAAFLDRFKEAALKSLELSISSADVSTFTLEYIDRFIFQGDETAAEPALLLPIVDNMLHPDALSGEKLWHLHRGWYESLEGIELLINQNFDAQEGVLPDSKKLRSVQVLTKTERRNLPPEVDLETILKQLDTMHDRSKAILSDVLNDEICVAIGLSE